MMKSSRLDPWTSRYQKTVIWVHSGTHNGRHVTQSNFIYATGISSRVSATGWPIALEFCSAARSKVPIMISGVNSFFSKCGMSPVFAQHVTHMQIHMHKCTKHTQRNVETRTHVHKCTSWHAQTWTQTNTHYEYIHTRIKNVARRRDNRSAKSIHPHPTYLST